MKLLDGYQVKKRAVAFATSYSILWKDIIYDHPIRKRDLITKALLMKAGKLTL